MLHPLDDGHHYREGGGKRQKYENLEWQDINDEPDMPRRATDPDAEAKSHRPRRPVIDIDADADDEPVDEDPEHFVVKIKRPL